MAFDWAWEKGQEQGRAGVQDPPVEPHACSGRSSNDEPFRAWAVEFGSALHGRSSSSSGTTSSSPSRPGGVSVPTRWHQDEGYWGRAARRPGHHVLDAVPRRRPVERLHALHRRRPPRRRARARATSPEVQSDLLECAPDESRAVACPLELGGVTFHHSKTPHMTPANTTDSWRRILTQHLKLVGVEGEGDHYPWKVYVNQVTGERIVPEPPVTDRARPLRGRTRCAMAQAAGEVAGRPTASTGRAARSSSLLATTGPRRGDRARQVGSGRRQAGRHAGEHGHAGVLRARRRRAARRRRDGRARRRAPRHLEVGQHARGRARSPHGRRRRGIPVVAMTGCGGGSALCAVADAVVDVGVERECDPHDLAPDRVDRGHRGASATRSPSASMVAKGFGPDDFHRTTPAARSARGSRARRDRPRGRRCSAAS